MNPYMPLGKMVMFFGGQGRGTSRYQGRTNMENANQGWRQSNNGHLIIDPEGNQYTRVTAEVTFQTHPIPVPVNMNEVLRDVKVYDLESHTEMSNNIVHEQMRALWLNNEGNKNSEGFGKILTKQCIETLCQKSYPISKKLPHSKAVDEAVWGTYGISRKEPLRWVRLCDCSKEHLQAILSTQDRLPRDYREIIKTILWQKFGIPFSARLS